MYYVYILHSDVDQGLYIGFTSDLSARVQAHNAGQSKSTSSRYPLRLIYYEAYTIREDAMGRERFLKSGSGRHFLDKQLAH
jgi:putative endonuclease